jgi:hypothetical protein
MSEIVSGLLKLFGSAIDPPPKFIDFICTHGLRVLSCDHSRGEIEFGTVIALVARLELVHAQSSQEGVALAIW